MDVIKNFLTVHVLFRFSAVATTVARCRLCVCAGGKPLSLHARWLAALFTNTAELKVTPDNGRAAAPVESISHRACATGPLNSTRALSPV